MFFADIAQEPGDGEQEDGKGKLDRPCVQGKSHHEQDPEQCAESPGGGEKAEPESRGKEDRCLAHRRGVFEIKTSHDRSV